MIYNSSDGDDAGPDGNGGGGLCFRDCVKPSHFVSELEHGKKTAQFLMQHVPHIVPFSEVSVACSSHSHCKKSLFWWGFFGVSPCIIRFGEVRLTGRKTPTYSHGEVSLTGRKTPTYLLTW